MSYKDTIKIISLLVIASVMFACKSSDVEDIFRRCAPECTNLNSPIPVEEAQDTFEQVVESIVVDDSSLDGRWVMLAVTHYAVKNSELNASSDLLFTKSMVFTELSNQVQVSDCYQSEIYDLDVNGFTIPMDSVFFSSLPFVNQNDIEVEIVNNTLLTAQWVFTTPQDTQATVTINMYKVSDSNSASVSLGSLGAYDIYCYSYLHLYTAGEQKVLGNWVEGEYETKEMLLKINPASGDDNVALSKETSNGSAEYGIVFNEGIVGEEYACFGETGMTNTTNDFLSFEGSYDIQFVDNDCMNIGGKSLGEVFFSFTAL